MRDYRAGAVADSLGCDILAWAGKKDLVLYQDAKRAGYDVVVTNDNAQMSDPDECREVKRAGMHRVSYKQRHPGLRGLAVAMASLIAAMPDVVAELANADGAEACFGYRH
jgi:hypothetical protein